MYLQDGVRHGGEEPVSLQDEDVPQAKSQRERRLQETHNRSPCHCGSFHCVYGGGSVRPLSYCMCRSQEVCLVPSQTSEARGPPLSRATQRDGEVLTAARSCQTTATTGLWVCTEETNSSLASQLLMLSLLCPPAQISAGAFLLKSCKRIFKKPI